MKSLLVEDNPADARLIREMLRDSPAAGFELQHVTRLDAARERLRQEVFDVVLLDLGLPDSQGMETLTLMAVRGSVPILVLTGRDDERFALEAVRAGAQDYLVKGRFDGQLLVRTIRYAVERKRIEEEVRRLNAELERRVEERTAELRRANRELAKEVVERKQAEMGLAEAKEIAESHMAQLRTTLDNLAEAVYVCDREGKPLLTNPAFEGLTGLTAQRMPQEYPSIVGRFPLYDMNGEPVQIADRPVSVALRGEIVRGRELRLGGQSDGDKIVRYNAAPVRDAQGNIVMAVLSIEDITASKLAEAALIRSEKLASVGRMAATIAHEINNPLAAVMNTIFIARENADSPGLVREALTVADEELRRIAHLTRQTLGFYRESIAPTNMSVNEVLDSAVDLLKSKIKGKRATIRKQYEGEIEVLGVPGELRQVFSNLIGNSLDAVEEGGTISLSIAPCGGDTRGERVAVGVADNGRGIMADALPHIFEPFFTTKQEVGTGLGMWIAKQIVEKHGGSIRLQSSTEGARRGTAVSILLPINAERAAAQSLRGETKAAAAGRIAS